MAYIIFVNPSILAETWHASEIHWDRPEAAIPAFLTITTIPLTFSIANGLAIGFTVFTFLQVVSGRWRKVNWVV